MRTEYISAETDEYVILETPADYQPPTHLELWHIYRREYVQFVNKVFVRKS